MRLGREEEEANRDWRRVAGRTVAFAPAFTRIRFSPLEVSTYDVQDMRVLNHRDWYQPQVKCNTNKYDSDPGWLTTDDADIGGIDTLPLHRCLQIRPKRVSTDSSDHFNANLGRRAFRVARRGRGRSQSCSRDSLIGPFASPSGCKTLRAERFARIGYAGCIRDEVNIQGAHHADQAPIPLPLG